MFPGNRIHLTMQFLIIVHNAAAGNHFISGYTDLDKTFMQKLPPKF
jgi:hypothetical protein